MYSRIMRQDMAKNKIIAITTTIFVAAASLLVSLAAILAVNLSGAIDSLMTQAKTPHFLQMHAGEIDHARLEAFAEENGRVDAFQAAPFLNVDSARIIIDGRSLAGSVQDNGFVTQGEGFDYLLDLDGQVIQAAEGEVYVPIAYMKDGSAKRGSLLEVNGMALTVAGFLRDSQMNSLLASSKRFLVSDRDYAELTPFGSTEYLIEFRLKDLVDLAAFETDYASAKLEANGPALTYPLFRTLNAISDGLMIAVIFLVSALVVAIAFLCIRFTLLAKIEDDYREIGVMKAIGLRLSDMKKIYVAQYAAIAVTASAAGFALSFLFRGMLLQNIRLYMGESGRSALAAVCGAVGALLVALAIIAYVYGLLARFRRISVAEALRYGASQENAAGGKRLRLSRNRWLDVNVFLGVKDVLSRKKLYATLLAVLVLSAFIIQVPLSLHHTIASKSFVTYMGIGKSDLRIDIRQTGDISGKASEIAGAMESDPAIARVAVLTTKTFFANREDGTEQRLKIELGDHSVFPVTYADGREPAGENEISLSALNANELGKEVGDSITLTVAGMEKTLTVSGIYSDVTNGGKTAKAAFADDSADTMWSVVSAELHDKSLVSPKVSEYGGRFAYAKASGIQEFVDQTFGSTISSVGVASKAAIIIALGIMLLVTMLFMRMLVAKDRYAIAVMKAFGYTDTDLRTQYVSRAVFILALALVLGTLLAGSLGEALAGGMISSFGASSFAFDVNPLSSYLLLPSMMAGTVLIAALVGASGTGRIQIADHIKE